MKHRFQHTIVASALLALGFAAAPVLADAAADKIASYVEVARSVFGGDKTVAEAVSAAAKDKATAGEIAAAVAAAQVAKKDAGAKTLAGIANAAGDFAAPAAATVAAVTGVDIASAFADPAVADAAKNPSSVLTGSDKAALKDLYEKVLAALKGAGYMSKGDGDKVKAKGKSKKAKDKDKEGKDEATAEAEAEAEAAGAEAKDGGDDAKDGMAGGSSLEDVAYDDDQNLGDPLDQTKDSPYEFHATPTTLSGVDEPVFVPVTPAPPKEKKPPKKPVEEPVEEPVYIGSDGEPWTPTTQPSPTPVGLQG